MSIGLYQTRRDYLAELLAKSRGYEDWTADPHQQAPDGDWFFWLLEGGRGSGKSVAAALYVRDHLNGPPCISDALPHRVALIAPTLGDAVESAELNEIALIRTQPGASIHSSRGGTLVQWPNGSQVKLFGVHSRQDVERLRAGGNRCLVWAEELAAWRYLQQGWEMLQFGLRLGPRPHIISSTTPKPRPEYKVIRGQADHITKASIVDNLHLGDDVRQRWFDLYDGTALGAQELHGELVEEAEGALWNYQLISAGRLPEVEPARIVVAVDPPGGATEAGIVAASSVTDCRCGGDRLPHFAVLADRSGKLTPDGWGSRAVALFHDLEADRVVGEVNYGGDMVEAVIAGVDRAVPYKAVRASRGKRQRAEPIKALYEQNRVHHIGSFGELEAEMVQWVPDESPWSPNRLDALVWALTELSSTGSPQIWFA